MPYHSIESWISKVQAMLERAHEIQSTQRTAIALNRKLGDDEKTLIRYKRDDIQALARDIANDGAGERARIKSRDRALRAINEEPNKKTWILRLEDMEPFNND